MALPRRATAAALCNRLENAIPGAAVRVRSLAADNSALPIRLSGRSCKVRALRGFDFVYHRLGPLGWGYKRLLAGPQ